MRATDILALDAYVTEHRRDIETNGGSSWKDLAARIGKEAGLAVSVTALREVLDKRGIVRARGKPSVRIAELTDEVAALKALLRRCLTVPAEAIAPEIRRVLGEPEDPDFEVKETA